MDAEVGALIALLDDPDPAVQEAVDRRLEEIGRNALPCMRRTLGSAGEPLRTILAERIHSLHLADVEQAWNLIMEMPFPDLERGAFLLARYRFPDVRAGTYSSLLDEMADGARSHLDGSSGVAGAAALCSYFCTELGFRGNREEYFDENNSYITWVLDHRRGIPVSLSTVFLLLGRRLGLPVFGVNMPGHFLVKFEDRQSEFYLDLFNGGTPVARSECVRFLMKAGIRPRPSYFAAADSRTILLRMARNLVAIAYQTNEAQVLADLNRLLEPWDVGVG
jgi:regulator of sirC expression with transglutaminase-like and TPR domain